jgi:gamma-carbonic anhydrase
MKGHAARRKGPPAPQVIRERLRLHLGRTPDTSGAAFVAASATVVGDVVLGSGASVFYGSVLRGDINSIRVGEGTNIQDNVVVHLADELGVRIGAWCTIGHGSVVHACTIGDECLVGMGSTVLDGAVIGARSVVGANSLVPRLFKCPAGSLVYGSPARVVRPLAAAEKAGIRKLAQKYVLVARAHAGRANGR